MSALPPSPSGFRRRLAWALGAMGVAGMAAAFAGLGVLWVHGRGVAGIDADVLRSYVPSQVTRVLARDGRVIGEIFQKRRTFVPYERLPSHVENAFLASEDADFYHHEGLDYFGIARALLTNISAGDVRQGASTITQQVVKVFLLSPERTLERKVQELLLARRVEQTLDKHAILELYLNEIYLGHGRYGVEEASRFYFGKGVADIDVGQAAVLAGLPRAPSRDSPFDNPEGAKRRQVYVLQQMVAHGFVGARDADRFIAEPLRLAAPDQRGLPVAGAEEFVDLVHHFLEQRFGKERLDTLGATVHTTVDLELQRAAKAAALSSLRALDRREGYGHGIEPAKPANLERALHKAAAPPEVGAVLPVVIGARPSGVELPAAGFPGKIGERDVFVRVPEGSRYDDPELTLEAQFPVGGITMAKVTAPSAADLPAGFAEATIGSGPEAALLLVDARTGEVLAMVGGAEYARGGFNRAVQARRQPGSAFKPFVYGAALESRRFTAATRVSDSPEIYEKWRPTNFERDVYRGEVRLREALTHSINTVAIKLLDAVGTEPVRRFAAAAGIDSPLVDNLSLALGTSEVTPFELLRAYTTLARGGTRIEPHFVRAVQAHDEAPWTATVAAEPAIADDVVFVLTSLMTSVVAEGTATDARALGRPVAGKTGTSADNRDAWFAGFTPKHAAVAWVGFDTPRALGRRETGGRAALPMWLETMKAAEGRVPAAAFVPPPTVVVRSIDRATGLLAAPEASADSVLEEYFLAGTEPTETAVAGAAPVEDAVLDLYAGAGPAPEPPAPVPAEAPAPVQPLPPPP